MSSRLSAQRVLLFEAAGQAMGVFVAEVTRLRMEDEVGLSPVPFAHPAMAGLLDAGEVGVLPVFDLEGVLDPGGRLAARQAGATVAIFSTERGPIGLRMTRRGTATDYRYGVDPAEEAERLDALPAPLRELVMGVGERPEGTFFFFSPEAFVVTLERDRAPGA
jgi:chemotaxis signal transduction protein